MDRLQNKGASVLDVLEKYLFQLPLTPSDPSRDRIEGFMGALFNNKQFEVVVDKELARAMPPKFTLDQYVQMPRQQIPFKDLGAGAWFADLHEIPFMPVQMERMLEDATAQRFSAAHYALALYNKAGVLYLPKGSNRNIILEELESIDAGMMKIELLFIIIEEGAVVTITDTVGAQAFKTRAIFGHIGVGAQLSYVTDFRYSQDAYGIEHESWHVDADAQFSRITALTGGVQSYHFQEYTLGQGASLEQIALSALRGEEQSALITKQKHVGEASRSSVLVKAALSDEARSFYRGTIAITEQAKLSEAHQQQRALMLSSKARACAIPSLEVATHDVKCSHGSAAGRFNAEEMGYLCARGLDRAAAEKLLIRGFFNEQALEKHDALAFRFQEQLTTRCIR